MLVMPYCICPVLILSRANDVLSRNRTMPSLQCTLVHHIIPYHTIPYHTIPYHTIPYHTIPYHTIPYHTTPYHTIPHHTIPYHTIPYHTIPYHTMPIPYHTIPYHTIPHHTTPYHEWWVVGIIRQPTKATATLLRCRVYKCHVLAVTNFAVFIPATIMSSLCPWLGWTHLIVVLGTFNDSDYIYICTANWAVTSRALHNDPTGPDPTCK